MDALYEKKIGNKIRSIREKRKITQEELSAKLQVRGCDITRSALAKIEVGQRHIYPDEIRHFKEILNVEYDDLFNVLKEYVEPKVYSFTVNDETHYLTCLKGYIADKDDNILLLLGTKDIDIYYPYDVLKVEKLKLFILFNNISLFA